MKDSSIFRLKDLPQELRLVIYPHALATLNKQLPNLLLVLGTDAFLKEGDYKKAVEIYRNINARITKGTEEIFRKTVRGSKFLKIRHITIMWDKLSDPDPYGRGWLTGHTCLLINNFENITLDLTRSFPDPFFKAETSLHFMGSVIKASRCLSTVAVVLNCHADYVPFNARVVVYMGLNLEGRGKWDTKQGNGQEVWV